MVGIVLPVFVWWIIVGLIAGWLAGKIMRGSGFGVIGDKKRKSQLPTTAPIMPSSMGIGVRGGLLYTTPIATLGAVVLVALVRLVKNA